MNLAEKTPSAAEPPLVPALFEGWFASRGWSIRPHQNAMLERARAADPALLIAPTGGGKTLAGFLPSLIALHDKIERWGRAAGPRPHRLHTLYISPLKALAVDVRRNLLEPVEELGLDIRIESRTGDTPTSRRHRQRRDPPDILLTTPEQLALLLSYRDAAEFFASLDTVILDELHAIENSKRGDLLFLGLSRLNALAPNHRRVGLSATVADPERLARFLVPQVPGEDRRASVVRGTGGAQPHVEILASGERVPWSGHSGVYAIPDLLKLIAGAQTTLLFVNTRSQAERLFQELWRANEDSLPIALHHGSLSVEQRRKVEAAMGRGELKAVVCTSTLDLGIDWGAVDLVVQIGAPKGASRMIQRIGRANHRLDEPSHAIFVPSNRFEVLECEAARTAIEEGLLDGAPERTGALDVLAQHILGVAVSGPFNPDDLYGEVVSAAPYRDLSRTDFDKAVDFVATGGYALRKYDRYRRLVLRDDGFYRLAHPKVAERYRQNIGTIIEAPMLKVRLVKSASGSARKRGGRFLGEIEEMFIEALSPGDTFLFAGQVLAYEGMVETDVIVTRAFTDSPKVPSYMGGKFPLSTFLAERVRAMLADPKKWQSLPEQVSSWLALQAAKSTLPRADQMLVETFPRGARYFMVCYPFEGRLAHQTLGMLLTRRLERMRMRPLGFVASEYALSIWGLRDMSKVDLGALFDEDMLGDDLESWLAESYLMKRTFRNCATIAGLIEKRQSGTEKTGRQMTVSSDLIYDVLAEHEPDHILIRAAWDEAGEGLIDIRRLSEFLRRMHEGGGPQSHIVHRALDRVSPLAVPVLLDIGTVPVDGEAQDDMLGEAADTLIAEAMAE